MLVDEISNSSIAVFKKPPLQFSNIFAGMNVRVELKNFILLGHIPV